MTCDAGGVAALHAVSVIVTPPTWEPFTLDEAKLRAGLDWAPGDPRDDLMKEFIAAARSKVELDTGRALNLHTRDVFLDDLPPVLQLPEYSSPLQSVMSVNAIAPDGALTLVDAANYEVDLASARIAFTGGAWPSTMTLRALHPWVVRITAGYPDVDALKARAPQLHQAVGLMIAHYATRGRDATSMEAVNEMPYGYDCAIAPYTLVKVP